MPKSLKVHSGQRVDLVDYVHGANTFTKETEKFVFERTWLDRRARILDGFRVKIEDQTAFPGMVTVYNGNALDREGQLINNEQSVDDSRSVTLLGAGLTFYLEIEFSENVSDTDARFFWDPTQPNTAPALPGSDFSLNVATRVTPDWRVVTPVSTSGFSQALDPSSRRIPLMVLRTDGSNRITAAENPKLELVRAASVLEYGARTGDTTFRVLDARTFPATVPFDVDVGFGSGVVERRTVTSVDKNNHTLTVSAALADNHPPGAIVRVATGSASFVRENVDPSDTTHPDPAQRFWQASEVRGSALMSSKEEHGARDDLNLRALKDHVDFLAAQLRELKFGDPNPSVTSAAPPNSFANKPRYFDPAGSVQGARSNTVSIGNGSTSFGDFNGTDATVFIDAINALPSGGGTIFVKEGTYQIDAQVVVTKDVTIVGESKSTVVLSVTDIGPVAGFEVSSASGSLSLLNVTAQTTSSSQTIRVSGSASLIVRDSIIVGQLSLGDVRIYAENTEFTTNGTVHSDIFVGGFISESVFYNCTFNAATGTVPTGAVFKSRLAEVTIDRCTIVAEEFIGDYPAGISTVQQTVVSNFAFQGNRFINCQNNAAVYDLRLIRGFLITYFTDDAVIRFAGSSGIINEITLDTLSILVQGSSSGHILHLSGDAQSAGIRLQNVEVITAEDSLVRGVYISRNLEGAVEMDGCRFVGTSTMLEIDTAHATMTTECVLKVVDCVHDNAENSTGDVIGVLLGDGTRFKRVEVRGCSFLNYSNTLGTDADRVGVLADKTETDLVVNSCLFESFKSVGARKSAGIHATIRGFSRSVTVDGCEFRTILGESSGHDSYGIYIQPSDLIIYGGIVHVTNNTIRTVGELNKSTRSAGVYVRYMGEVFVGDNLIDRVNGNGSGGFVSGIHLDEFTHAKIHNNTVTDCRSSLDVSIDSLGTAIRVLSVNSAATNISHNTIVDVAYGVYVYGGFLAIRNVVIDGNTIAAWLAGIAVVRSSEDANIYDVVISNNEVELSTRGSEEYIGTGISCTLGSKSKNINIQGNTVRSAHDVPSRGIEVKGTLTVVNETRGVLISGNILTGPTDIDGFSSEDHVGVIVRDVHYSTVSNNYINWSTVNNAEGGFSIKFVAGVSHIGATCVGNMIVGDGSKTGTVDIATGLSQVLVANNSFVLAPSPINPPTALSGWLYANNLIG